MRILYIATAATLALPLAACGGGSSSGDYCAAVKDAKAAFDAVDSGDMPFDDPKAMKELFTDADKAVQSMASKAPDEISDEFELIANSYSDVIDALEKVDYDFIALMGDEDSAAVLEQMDSDEFNDATDTVDEYNLKECGVTLEDKSDDTSPDNTEATDDTVAETTDTVAGEDTTSDSVTPDDMSIEAAAGAYMQIFGLDEDKATCLAEKTIGLSEADSADTTKIMGFFADCDISMSDIAGAMQS